MSLIKCLFCLTLSTIQVGKAYKYCTRYYCAVCGRWLRTEKDFKVLGD